ncbi:MAG: iron-containing alcohol dehydrogenase [Haemophilus sp.]|nr:iron-containing alcohol dehydrogenase [Haemophilus sp.]
MYPFSFQNPTRIEFGLDKEKEMGKYMHEYGAKKALIIYGSERIKHSGLFEDVAKSLREHGIEYVECGGVKSNPTISKVREAVAMAKAFGADSVLSIGGGSCLDSAKAIAAGACYEGDTWDFFKGTPVQKALMIFDVITLAATGSEMNWGAVITNEETQQKYSIHSNHLFPKVSVINFTAEYRPEIIDFLVESNIKTVIRTTEILLNDPQDLNARGEFAWAATLALNGLTHLGISPYGFPNHMIEHSMSAISDVPHGAGLSVIMPAWMQWYQSQRPAQFKRFAKEIFGLDKAEDGIQALKTWFDKIGTPTRLEQLGIDDKTLAEIVDNAVQTAIKAKMDKIYTKEAIEAIFALAK